MGQFTFSRDAGKRLAQPPRAAQPDDAPSGAGGAIVDYVRAHNIDAKDLQIDYDAKTLTAVVRGTAKDQVTREMIVLLAGNVHGVEKVDDQLQVASSRGEPAADFYTVQSGDSLSKIAKQFYGDARRYPEIFEANRPLLKDPDEIFPGQVLRVPRGKAH